MTPKDADSARSAGQWTPGPWAGEPDRKEWLDQATGLPCLAMRNGGGAWCGYVAVPTSHPAHGLSYHSDAFDIEDLLNERRTLDHARTQLAVNNIEVHGGLTFAGAEREHAAAPERAWWFGFDCSHAGDYSPRFDRADDPVLGLGKPTGWGGVITYRTLAYVEEQCALLADQLAAIALAHPEGER